MTPEPRPPSSRSDSGAHDPATDDAIDEYLRQVGDGSCPTIDIFCARHGRAGGELERRLRALQKVLDAAPPVKRDEPSLVGQVLGEFRIQRKIGQGGMGTVYLAEQLSLHRAVAVKVLRGDGGFGENAQRFQREAEVLAKVRHANIVNIIAAGQDRGIQYLAMELVQGTSLAAVYKKAKESGNPIAATQILRWLVPVARALTAAHDAGIVHRDVKPSNILIDDRTGRAQLSDFGLARLLESESLALSQGFRGTPFYAAPEQVDSSILGKGPLAGVDGRADVYGLGATLYEGLTGQPPFQGVNLDDVFRKILAEEPAPVRKLRPSIPRDLDTVVMKALEKAPARRYATAANLADDLDAVLHLQPIRARPVGLTERVWKWTRRNRIAAAAAAVASLAVVAALTFVAFRSLADSRAVRREIETAEAARALGDFDKAALALERALALAPADTGALQLRETLRDERDRAESKAALDAARTAIGEYAQLRIRASGLNAFLDTSRAKYTSAAMSTEEVAAMEHDENELGELRQRQAQLSIAIEENLARAALKGRDSDPVHDAYAEFYMGRHRDSLDEDDLNSADVFREQVLAHDVHGMWATALEGRATVSIEHVPADAALYLFRYELQSRVKRGGERRLVPVPYGPRTGLQVLILTRTSSAPASSTPDPAPDIAPGDVVVEILDVGRGPLLDFGLTPGDFVTSVNGVPVEQGLWVTEVKPDSAAVLAGVQLLDRMTRVGDLVIGPKTDAYAASALGARKASVRPEHAYEGLDGARRIIPSETSVNAVARGGVSFTRAADLLFQSLPKPGLTFRCVSSTGTVEIKRPSGIADTGAAQLTANPLLRRAQNCLTGDQRETLVLPAGSYLLTVVPKSSPSYRVPFVIHHAAPTRFDASGPPAPGPAGFVWIAPGPFRAGGDRMSVGALPPVDVFIDGFWMQDHETMVEEYANFLDDPLTRAEIAKARASGSTVFVPRTPSFPEGTWKEVNGRFVPVNTSSRVNDPVSGIAYDDAVAFAKWRTRAADVNGDPWTYDLPTELEWEKAARGVDGRIFPWGNSFAWSFCNSPWYLSWTRGLLPSKLCCRDESVWGVRDLAGSLREWCHGTDDPLGDRGRKVMNGGSFSSPDPASFRSATRFRVSPRLIDSTSTVRLVARPKEKR